MNSRYKSHDNKELELYTWDNVASPKAVVKISHGMAEHAGRYEGFAQYLNDKGYIVVSNDHRGHGKSSTLDSLGYADGDIFADNMQDQIQLVDYCKEKYKLPVILFGHSYGSFVTQAAMQNGCRADGYILCGSNYIKGLSYSLCGVIANNLCKNRGVRYPATTIANLSFGMYEKKMPGKNCWLNRVQEEVDKYNNDPMCGFVCSASFYRSFMKGIKPLYKKESYSNIDTTKPLLIISGDADAVGEYGKGVKKLINFYTNTVKLSVTSHLYPGARHEIMLESNKQEVYDDIYNWLQSVTK